MDGDSLWFPGGTAAPFAGMNIVAGRWAPGNLMAWRTCRMVTGEGGLKIQSPGGWFPVSATLPPEADLDGPGPHLQYDTTHSRGELERRKSEGQPPGGWPGMRVSPGSKPSGACRELHNTCGCWHPQHALRAGSQSPGLSYQRSCMPQCVATFLSDHRRFPYLSVRLQKCD